MFNRILKKLILSKIDLNSHLRFLKSKATGNEKHILIACLPKSGSTFIAKTLCEITGFKFVQFQPVRATNDHNIDSAVFYNNLSINTVTQLHLKPNLLNRKLLIENRIKVIFLYRGILDSLRSFNNHILSENDQWFMFTATNNYEEWAEEKQFDFLIDMVLPWYINFITSWRIELELKEIDILEIDYDDFNHDNENTLRKVLKFYGLNYSDEIIQKGLNFSFTKKTQLRYNKDLIKKKYTFNDKQLKRIKNMISYYPKCLIKI